MSKPIPSRPGEYEPRFDVPVPTSGYRWWYVDGLSADGQCGIVIIAFIGSVFSPYYFRARRRGPADPENHCAINVGLYRPGGKRWAMTERGQRSLTRSAEKMQLGPSNIAWQDDSLTCDIEERAVPFGQRLRGRVRLTPRVRNEQAFSLDAGAKHIWQPLSPSADIEVDFDKPDWHWRGHAYFDTNHGERSLEDDFLHWNWSRSTSQDSAERESRITYAITQNDGERRALALRFSGNGDLHRETVPPSVQLPKSGWRVARETRSTGQVSVVRTLEDAPFYARSILDQKGGSDPGIVMHENLALDRFRAGWVRCLLPFRMPRVR